MGCEIEIKGLKPTFCEPYPAEIPGVSHLRTAANSAIQSFKNGSADFTGMHLYF